MFEMLRKKLSLFGGAYHEHPATGWQHGVGGRIG
jgi:hypothetical protein